MRRLTLLCTNVLEPSTSHTGELHSAATGLPLVPYSLHVASDPATAAFSTTTTSALFVPAHTVIHQTSNFGDQQTLSVHPSALHPPYVQYPATSTSAFVPSHGAVYPMTYAGHSYTISGPPSAPNLPQSTSALPLPTAFPTGSTSTIFGQSQTVGQFSTPAQLLQVPSGLPTPLRDSHFLDCCESGL